MRCLCSCICDLMYFFVCLFVLCVLRYGLPVNFQAMIMLPNKRSQKRLREVLNQLYSHLDTTSMSGSDVSVYLIHLYLFCLSVGRQEVLRVNYLFERAKPTISQSTHLLNRVPLWKFLVSTWAVQTTIHMSSTASIWTYWTPSVSE